jgi:hypothetical protein
MLRDTDLQFLDITLHYTYIYTYIYIYIHTYTYIHSIIFSSHHEEGSSACLPSLIPRPHPLADPRGVLMGIR